MTDHPAQSLGAFAVEVMDRIGIGQTVGSGGPKSGNYHLDIAMFGGI